MSDFSAEIFGVEVYGERDDEGVWTLHCPWGEESFNTDYDMIDYVRSEIIRRTQDDLAFLNSLLDDVETTNDDE